MRRCIYIACYISIALLVVHGTIPRPADNSDIFHVRARQKLHQSRSRLKLVLLATNF